MTLNKDPKKRRITPADRPEVLNEWREKERHYVEDLGLSRHIAHQKIAEEYHTSMHTARNWLTYGMGSKPRARPPYSERTQYPTYRQKTVFLKRFFRDPARYIVPLVRGPPEPESFSLDDLSLRLSRVHDYLPRLTTLERIAHSIHPKTQTTLLDKVSDNPPLYRVNEVVYSLYAPQG